MNAQNQKKKGRPLTENSVSFAVFISAVGPDEGTEVVVLYLVLVLFNKFTPALLSICALHPVFVEFY